VNLKAQHAALKAELLDAVAGVLDRADFILGGQVEEFERRFAELIGVRHAVAVNSGTDALMLALRVLDVGAGAEVITAPNSFVASASAIAMVGARPVFADVGPDYNIDPEQVEKAITSRTKAILPVHLTGRPANMDAIADIARRHRLAIVEDAAQAVLAEFRGKRVGSFGAVGCFSLHPLKTLNACGDGGVLTTDDDLLAARLRIMRNLGLRTRHDCVEWSGNSRLDTLQAAILLVKLQHVEKWTADRRKNAAYYRQSLCGTPAVRVPDELPHEGAVYHTFVVEADRREELKAFLAERGVATAIHYPVPIHLQAAAAYLGYRRGSFPVAESQAERIISLPNYPELQPEDIAYVTSAIHDFYVA
jgi:dTDP-4-amino-4,6-dideoxygalactose transaminase